MRDSQAKLGLLRRNQVIGHSALGEVATPSKLLKTLLTLSFILFSVLFIRVLSLIFAKKLIYNA